MDFLSNLLLGLQTSATFGNLGACLLGAILGTAIGVLPGLGPTATISILLPVTFGMSPEAALIMLAGIYYGAQYGGSTTAILVNLPGEPSSVVTALEGYRLAQKGEASRALAVAAIGSFIAGTVATVILGLFSPPLVEVAIDFGPTEYFSLMVLGLIASIVLAEGPLLHALAMIALGITLGLVGIDANSGDVRLALGMPELYDGIDFVVVAMGVFGISEVLANVANEERRSIITSSLRGFWPDKAEWKRIAGPIMRGTGMGALLGILPGGGAMLASFASYSVEKKFSQGRDKFGQGAIEGVAGPEAANNAASQTSFIPLLTLGIPSNAVMALMVGALTIQGIQPGPMMMIEQPSLFWGVIVSMWIGNLFLLALNLPLVGMWAKMITIPYHYLYPAIIVFCTIGAFSLSNSVFDIYAMCVLGLLGYWLRVLGCEVAPLLLGFILGPMIEENFRRSMLLSSGDPTVFVTKPISAGILALTVLLLCLMILPAVRRRRSEAFHDSEA